MRNIQLKLDEDFFFKMKRDKFIRERAKGSAITWEDYIKLLFGFRQ